MGFSVSLRPPSSPCASHLDFCRLAREMLTDLPRPSGIFLSHIEASPRGQPLSTSLTPYRPVIFEEAHHHPVVIMEPALWTSHRTFFSQPGSSFPKLNTKLFNFPELSFELQRIICQRVIDGEHSQNYSDYSSLVAILGLDVASDACKSPHTTLALWQVSRNPELFHSGESRPITQSMWREAPWENHAYPTSLISLDDISAFHGVDSYDSPGDDHPSFTFPKDHIPVTRLRNDVLNCPGSQPSGFGCPDQVPYEFDRAISSPAGGGPLYEKSVLSTGYCLSQYAASTPIDAFSNIDFTNDFKPSSERAATLPIDLCPTSSTDPVNYTTSPLSVRGSVTSVDEDHQVRSQSLAISEVRRHAKDDFLVRSKRSGMSYRDIRCKGNFKEAESTLRGRYRTLTKCREQRVRKPQWHPKDVSLQSLNRLCITFHA